MPPAVSDPVLLSAAANVLVEAPAGCGKTHEACLVAVHCAEQIGTHQEVLLLTHTNAALHVFRRRLAALGARRTRAMTIDSFCLELLTPYARRLGLPAPLRTFGPDAVPFNRLARAAVDLLTRSPSVARALGLHYPAIILDEHQDAREEQHEVFRLIAAASGARLRIFGDPMQAIYGFDGERSVAWATLQAQADAQVTLDTPHRWNADLALGRWILDARRQLMAGGRIALTGAPPAVFCERAAGLRLGSRQARFVPELSVPLFRAVRACRGSLVVLTRSRANDLAVSTTLRRSVPINEGADLQIAETVFAKAVERRGEPRDMALTILELIEQTAIGLQRARRDALDRALRPERLDPGRRADIRPLVERFASLYAAPTIATWSQAIEAVRCAPPAWLTITLPDSWRLLGRLPPMAAGSELEAFAEVARRWKAARPDLRRAISTIHKAKGLEFDHVILPCCGRDSFADDESARRLLYVALSRARTSVHMIVPAEAPSPLLAVA